MKLRFELCNCDIEVVDYEGEETERQIERDMANFDSFVRAKRNHYGDRFDKIDDFRYELSNLTERELDWNLAMLDVLEEEFEICFISSKYEE